MSNVTLQSIGIRIVVNNVATTMRMTCYLTGNLHIISFIATCLPCDCLFG